MVLVHLAGSRGDVLLDGLALPDSLEDELLHVLVQALVDVVDVVEAEILMSKLICFIQLTTA